MGFIARVFRLHFSLWLGLAVLAVVALATPASAGLALRLAAGWDAGVAAFLILTLVHILRSSSQAAIRRRAAELDQVGRAGPAAQPDGGDRQPDRSGAGP